MSHISRPWAAAALLWVCGIFFSSTNLAEQWAVVAFSFFTGQMQEAHPQHGWFFLLVDKGFHVTMFLILSLLLCQAIQVAPRKELAVLCMGAVVGSCSEYLQSFFPGRDPAIRDVFINIAGAALGLLLYRSFPLKHSGRPAASTNLQVSQGTPVQSGRVYTDTDGR